MNTIRENESPEFVTSAEQEITAAMNDVAVVDRSFFGRIRISGADRLDLLHRLSTNDLLLLKPYSSMGTVFTTDKGRIVDYVRVIVRPSDLILIISPGYEEKVKTWIEKYTIMEDIQVSIVTDEVQMLSLLGPNALSVAREIFPEVPSSQNNLETRIQGIVVTLDNQQEFSISCLNILFPTTASTEKQTILSEMLLQKCRELSNEAYDCFRITNGIPSGTTELTESFNPFEVGLRHSISFVKGCYIGQEVIARLDTYHKVQRGLVLFSIDQALSPSNHHLITIKDSEEIGVLTSVAKISYQSSSHALGVIKIGKLNVGDPVIIKTQCLDIKGVTKMLFEQSPS